MSQARYELLLKRLLAVEEAANDLITFARLIMPDPSAPDDVSKSLYDVARHHEVIAAALEQVESGKYSRLIVNVPPRHGKTELVSKLFLSWYMGRNPYNSTIFGTYNETYARDIGKRTRDYMTSPVYSQIFPEVSLKSGSKAADRLETEQGGIMAFVGRGGTTTGRGGDLLLVDDPIKNQKEAMSPTIRNDLWDWFQKVIKTRMMTKDARIVVVQTRWHEDDIVGRITDPTNDYYDVDEAKKWKIIDLPALAMQGDPLGRKQGEALWPRRFDEAFLLDQQRSDPKGFSALYQGRPTPDGGFFFRDEYLKTYKPSELPKNLRYYVASDHAVSTAQNSDKTCIIPIGIDENDNIYVLPDVWWRIASTDQVVEAMLMLMKKYRPLFWWAERSHITKSIGPFLRKRMREENVHCSIYELTPLVDKQTRAQSIQGRMAQGKVFFPERVMWWPPARDELLKFPGAAHDDFVDAMAYVGIGLALQVSAARPKGLRNQRPLDKRMTFGDMLTATRREAQERASQTSAGGW